MEKIDLKHNWSKMAIAYENYISAPTSFGNMIEIPAVKTLLPCLRGKRVLDLGCGSGRFSFLLEEMDPKETIAIDFSEEMVAIAKEKGKTKGSKVKFIQGNIENLANIDSDSIDFVFSSTVLHFIKDLEGVLREINRVLKSKGTSILSLIHPVYSAKYPIAKIDSSFPSAEEWQVRYLNTNLRAYVQPWIQYNDEIDNFLTYSYHHTMGDYINAFVNSGFVIKSLTEPLPPEMWETKKPRRYYQFLNTPTYAIFEIVKW